jgi:hypothetical protein
MGLIKAAIIVGGGAYAIKKLQKRHEQKKQNRMQFDENMSQQQQRDFPPQQYYDDEKRGPNGGGYYSDYPAEKGNSNRGEKQLYNNNSQRSPSPVHPYALEFVDRRSPQQQQAQPLHLNNSHGQPLPQSHGFNNEAYYAQGPPPQYHQQMSSSRAQRTPGFVEPDEVSSQSDAASAWDRKGRRESGSGSGGQTFLNTLAQQASGLAGGSGSGDRKGSSSPREYLETHLSR